MPPLTLPDIRDVDLSRQQRAFFARVYAGDLSRYAQRLHAVGIAGKQQVLDLGCGFGQWTAALGTANGSVCGVDMDPVRVEVARRVCITNGIHSARFCVGRIEQLCFAENTFDAVFSYSVIYHGDEEKAIGELSRIVRPNGLVYLNFNSFGWFFYAFFKRGLLGKDKESFSKSGKAIARSLLRMTSGPHAVSSRRLRGLLVSRGFKITAIAGDGRLCRAGQEPRSFYPASVWGMEAVQELIAVRV